MPRVVEQGDGLGLVLEPAQLVVAGQQAGLDHLEGDGSVEARPGGPRRRRPCRRGRARGGSRSRRSSGPGAARQGVAVAVAAAVVERGGGPGLAGGRLRAVIDPRSAVGRVRACVGRFQVGRPGRPGRRRVLSALVAPAARGPRTSSGPRVGGQQLLDAAAQAGVAAAGRVQVGVALGPFGDSQGLGEDRLDVRPARLMDGYQCLSRARLRPTRSGRPAVDSCRSGPPFQCSVPGRGPPGPPTFFTFPGGSVPARAWQSQARA